MSFSELEVMIVQMSSAGARHFCEYENIVVLVLKRNKTAGKKMESTFSLSFFTYFGKS